MTEERIKRLDEISEELFKMANEFALEKKPGIAVFLHEAVNNISDAQKNNELNYDKVPVEFIERSCGLGRGTSMADLQIKDEMYAEDLEKDKNG
jgi:hypothetical protein